MKRGVFVFILYSLLAAILFYPVLFGDRILFQSNLLVSFFAPWNSVARNGVPFKPMGIDNLNLFYPLRMLTNWLFAAGAAPLWNPHNFSGSVLLANLQSAVLYPLHLVYRILPQIDAWNVLVMVQPVLASYFTYLLVRVLKVTVSGALLSGLVFGFSGEMLVWMGDHLVVSHTMLWLPLILFGIETFLARGSRIGFGLAVAGLASAFFAGFFQPFFYVAVTVAAYFLWRIGVLNVPKRRKLIGWAIFIFAIGIVSIQLFPTIEVFMYSARKTVDAGYLSDIYLMPVVHLVSLIAPDYMGSPATYSFFGLGGYHESVLFIGILPLFFAVYAWRARRLHAPVLFFASAAIISLAFGFNVPLMKQFYTSGIPLVSTFLPSRIFFAATFFIAMLAGFGFDAWRSKPDFRFAVTFFVVVFGVLGMLLLYAFGQSALPPQVAQWVSGLLFRIPTLTAQNVSKLEKGLLLPMGFGAASLAFLWGMRHKTKGTAFTGVALALVVIPLLLFGAKYLSLNERQYVYPAHPVFDYLQQNARYDRFWTYGDGYIVANMATAYGVYSPDGTDALFPRWLGELYQAAATEGKFTDLIDRIDARIPRAAEGEPLGDNQYRLRLLAITGTRFVTDWDKGQAGSAQKFPPDVFTPVWDKYGWRIYEYRQALPRAFLTNSYVVAREPQAQFDAIFGPKAPRHRLVLSEKPDIAIRQSAAQGSVAIASYAPNGLKLAFEAKEPSLLYISDTYYPGWRAFVDGREKQMLRANYAFRAVAVPAGARSVEMRYEPESFYWGVRATVVALTMFLLTLILLPAAGILRRE